MTSTTSLPRPEMVTVVLVDRHDSPVEVATVDAILQLVAPGPGIRIVVVTDRDGDLANAPWSVHRHRIEVVGAGRELSETGARNRGSQVASTPYVAFLDGGAIPSPRWLSEAVALLDVDGSVFAVASSEAGRDSAWSFTGLPAPAPGPAASAPELLAPEPHAVVVRTQRFLELGSYDDTLGVAPATLDLGWRAWIHGWRVVRAPHADVDGRLRAAQPATPERFQQEQADALTVIYRNYGDETLAAALPAALALVSARGAARGDAFAAAAARAVRSFDERLPVLRRHRAELAPRRRRTDAELLRLLRNPLAPPVGDESLTATVQDVVETFELGRHFGFRRRILVVTPDVLTARMAGPAIRAWQIATALAPEHEVRLATTSNVCENASPSFGVEAADDARLRELEAWADVIVIQGFVLEGRPFLRDSGKVLVVDIYDPLHLEQLELERDADDFRRRLTVRNATAVLNDQLVRGDFFICASPKQRDFWLGQLSGLGRVNPLTYDDDETLMSLLDIVPFGLPDDPPTVTGKRLKGVVPGIAPTDEVILWGGGIYNWFDPLTLVRAVDQLRRRRPFVRLFFMGMTHPNPEVAEMRMASATRQLADELQLTGRHVFFNEGWVAYDDRQNYLLEADVGVSTHLDHVETAFSFRTRILDYIWAALPVVATTGDSFAELIETEGLGITVPPNDVDALEAALFRLLDDREASELCRKRLAAMRQRFAWSVVLEPLVSFCRSPRRAPDLVDPEMASRIVAPERVWAAPPTGQGEPAPALPVVAPSAAAQELRRLVRGAVRRGRRGASAGVRRLTTGR